MSQGHRTLKDRMETRLTLATRWVSGAELSAGLSTSQPAIEDALSDLVSEQLAQFDQVKGYRLNASALCREAVRALQQEIRNSQQKIMFRRQVRGQPFDGKYRLGVAEYRPGSGLVTYEMEMELPDMPLPDDGQNLNKRAKQLLAIAHASTQERAYG